MLRVGTARAIDCSGSWRGHGFVLLLLPLLGCSSAVDEVPLSGAEKSLTYIALAYGDAHSELGRGPKDADELRPFLKVFGDPDALLISPNDGQPYVIVWGEDP